MLEFHRQGEIQFRMKVCSDARKSSLLGALFILVTAKPPLPWLSGHPVSFPLQWWREMNSESQGYKVERWL